MPFAAVISAISPTRDDPESLRAKLNFAGQALFEYQVRQAADAGAAHIVILVGMVTPDLSRAVDRLSRDGISVAMVRDMIALGREVGTQRDILLVADGAVIAQPYFAAMAARDGAAVLVADDTGAAASFERIDAHHRWAGLAKLTPAMLFDVLDMLGDWDLQSTLVRRAVQASAPRILVPAQAVTDGDVALVENQRGADFLASNIRSTSSISAHARPAGLFEHYVLAPLAGFIAPTLLRQQVAPEPVQIAAIALSVIGLVAAQLHGTSIALIIFLVGLFMAQLSGQLAMMGRRSPATGWQDVSVPIINLLGIAIIGGSLPNLQWGGMLGGVWLAIPVAVIEMWCRGQRRVSAPSYVIFSSGTATVLLLTGRIAGFSHIALAMATFLALASVAFLLLRSGNPVTLPK